MSEGNGIEKQAGIGDAARTVGGAVGDAASHLWAKTKGLGEGVGRLGEARKGLKANRAALAEEGLKKETLKKLVDEGDALRGERTQALADIAQGLVIPGTAAAGTAGAGYLGGRMVLGSTGGSVADLFNRHFSEESVERTQAEKIAAEVLGKPISEMTDEEVNEKLAALEEHESLVKMAELDYGRGQCIGQGFLDRLSEEGVELKDLNENFAKVAKVVSKS